MCVCVCVRACVRVCVCSLCACMCVSVCLYDPRRRTLAMGWMRTDGGMALRERFMSIMMTFKDR